MEMTEELQIAGIGEMASAALTTTVERLATAASMLEQTVERLFARQEALTVNAEASLERMVTTIESSRASERESELEQRLAAAEAEIAELRASGVTTPPGVTNSISQGRKTLPVSMMTLLEKQGVTVDSMEAGALDAALNTLSIEQRIAVKAQLMRAGLLG